MTAAARRAGVTVREYTSLDEVLKDTDVLYVTRVQRERFDSDEEYNRLKNAYIINQAVLARAKEDMIVMHPLPRLQGELRVDLECYRNADILECVEIDPDVDFDSRRAVYFRQMRYGLFVRFPDLIVQVTQC